MKKFFKGLGVCVLFTSIGFIMQFLVGLVFGVFLVFKEMKNQKNLMLDQTNMTSVITNGILENTIYILLVSFILSLIIIYFALRIINKKNNIIINQKIDYKIISIAFIMSIALNIALGYIMELVYESGLLKEQFDIYESIMNPLFSTQNILLLIFVVGILAPIFEELVFRGIIFGKIKSYYNNIVFALIIQGVCFGIYHLNLIQGLYATVLGIILGLIYIYTDSILIPILMHSVFNISSIIMSKYNIVLEGSIFIIGFIFSVIMIIGGIVLLARKSKTNYIVD